MCLEFAQAAVQAHVQFDCAQVLRRDTVSDMTTLHSLMTRVHGRFVDGVALVGHDGVTKQQVLAGHIADVGSALLIACQVLDRMVESLPEVAQYRDDLVAELLTHWDTTPG